MDQFHREITKGDTLTARVCGFCQTADSDFIRRATLDQLVHGSDSAAHHLTENGHVHHRLLELVARVHLSKRKLTHPAA
jgi:hypothetical protein